MRRNFKIRDRDGTVRFVDDDYILQDGEVFVVGLPFMDSRRGMFHDGRCHRAGERPGFMHSDANEQAVADAYREYDAAISEHWRQGPGQRSSQTRSAPQEFSAKSQTFDSAEAARADAYAQYDRDISERWRR